MINREPILCVVCAEPIVVPVSLGCDHVMDLSCLAERLLCREDRCPLDEIVIDFTKVRYFATSWRVMKCIELNILTYQGTNFFVPVYPSTKIERLKRILCFNQGDYRLGAINKSVDGFVEKVLQKLRETSLNNKINERMEEIPFLPNSIILLHFDKNDPNSFTSIERLAEDTRAHFLDPARTFESYGLKIGEVYQLAVAGRTEWNSCDSCYTSFDKNVIASCQHDSSP